MARPTVSPLQRQLARVRRRLFLQTLVHALVRAWVVALILAAGWFLAQPYLVRDAADWLRWAVLGGLSALATVAALGLTLIRRPSPVEAALALDSRFGLKERATTGVTLDPVSSATAAGQALLDDVNQRVDPLKVGEKFPVQLPWSSALVPLTAAAVVLIALFYRPILGTTKAGPNDPLTASAADAAALKEQMRQLEKKEPADKGEEKPKAKAVQDIEAELDKLARKPTDTRDEGREAAQEMTAVEDRIRKREKELADKVDALKEQMKQIDRLSKKKGKEDNPARNLDQAMDQGKFQRARDEAEQLRRRMEAEEKMDRLRKKLKEPDLPPEDREKLQRELDQLENNQQQAERLRKKLKDPELTDEQKQDIQDQLNKLGDQPLSPEEKQEVKEQLGDLEQKLQRLTRNKEDQAERLREMARKGEIDAEQLDRELEQLEKNGDKIDPETMKQLQELAKELEEIQKAMGEGNEGEAARQLKELAEKLGQMGEGQEGEMEALAGQLARLRQARQALTRALDGQPVPAAGRRPESKDGATQHQDTKAKSEVDKGKLQIVDFVPGGGFKGPRPRAEIIEDIKRAAQDAPAALDRQRLPAGAGDAARGFFEKMRGPEKK